MKLARLALVAVVVQLVSFNLQAETLAQAVEKCRVVSNSLKRLVCYDQLAQRANNLEDSELAEFYANRPVVAPVQGQEQAAQPAPRSSLPENTFGLENEVLREKKAEASEQTAVVGKVEEDPYGKLIITLSNGQVWKQTDAGSYKLSSGETITISRGFMGSFYLKKDGQNKRLRVKRQS